MSCWNGHVGRGVAEVEGRPNSCWRVPISHPEAAAHAKGVQLPTLQANSEGERDAAFGSLVQLRIAALSSAPTPSSPIRFQPGTDREDHLAPGDLRVASRGALGYAAGTPAWT